MTVTHPNDEAVGLLLLSGEGARLDEWRPRRTVEVKRFALDEPVTADAQEDLYERRLELHRVAFVRGVAAECSCIARERGWRLVLVLGDPHLTAPAAAALERGGIEVEESRLLLGWMREAELAAALEPEVEEALLAHAAGAAGQRR